MWVPGKELVDLGVDDLSRAAAITLHDVTLSSLTFKLASQLGLAYLGSPLSVNLFSSDTVHQLRRYWTLYPSFAAEGFDTLAADWLASPCQCGAEHSEIGYFFPPVLLLNPKP